LEPPAVPLVVANTTSDRGFSDLSTVVARRSGNPRSNAPSQHTHFHTRDHVPQGEEHHMGIGINIFLIAVGAILAFAVEATVAGLDITVVGYILMAAGAVGLILTLVVFAPRRRRTVTQTSGTRPASESSTATTDDASGTPLQ
jgi:hypothetical protein